MFVHIVNIVNNDINWNCAASVWKSGCRRRYRRLEGCSSLSVWRWGGELLFRLLSCGEIGSWLRLVLCTPLRRLAIWSISVCGFGLSGDGRWLGSSFRQRRSPSCCDFMAEWKVFFCFWLIRHCFFFAIARVWTALTWSTSETVPCLLDYPLIWSWAQA